MVLNWQKREVPWTLYGLVVALGVFLIIRLTYLWPRFSDGNIYLYLSYLVGQGSVPYRDFFYSSPPLILYLFSWYGKMFGFTWQAFGYIPLWLSVLDAIIIYGLVLKNGSHLGALVGSVWYILSFVTLATSDFTSDVHVVLTLILLGVAAGQKKWPLLSGAVLGLAVLAKLYAAVVLVGWAMSLAWQRKWRELFSLALGSTLVLGVIGGFVWWWSGDAFYDQVILSHKGEVEGLSRPAIMMFFIRHDWALALAPAGWLLVRKKVPAGIVWPIAALAGWFVLWPDFYYLYLKVLAAWLALWWGWVIAQLDQSVRRRELVYTVVVGLVIIGGVTVTRYRQEQARMAVIQPLDEIIEYVRSRTTEDEAVYGSFEVAPLVALGAGRPIWRNMADTNIKWFQTGWFDWEERTDEIKRDRVKTIITKAMLVKGGRMAAGPELVLPRKFFNENCRLGKTWPVEKDYTHNAVAVWLCEYQ